MREEVLIDAATWFFNDRVLGPDRLALIQASMPAAADVVHAEHRKTEQVIRRKIAEVSGGMDNLMRVLERTPRPRRATFRALYLPAGAGSEVGQVRAA